MSEKKILPVGFTFRVILLSIILGIIGILANIATWWGLGITSEPIFVGRVGLSIYPPYGFIFVLILASILLKTYGLTPEEIAVVSSIAFFVADSPFVIGVFLQYIFAGTYLAKTDPRFATLLSYYPSFWTPGLGKYDIIAPAWLGRAAAPFAELAPYLIFWMFITILWCLMMMFQAAIFRLWTIRKEKLPFPVMIPINEMLVRQREGRFLSTIKSTPFLTGFLLGSLVGLLGALNYIYKFTTVFYVFGHFYLPWLIDLLASISKRTTGTGWKVIPSDAAIFYLVPMDILSSFVLFGFLIYLVLPVLFVNTGIITPGTSILSSGPFPFGVFGGQCIPLAIGVWTLIFGFNTYKDSILKAIHHTKPKEGELSDTFVWAGFAATWVLWFILWVAVGANFLLMLTGLVVWFLCIFGITEINAATGHFVDFVDSVPPRNFAWGLGTLTGVFPSSGAAARTQAAWATMAGIGITSSHSGLLLQNSHSTWAYLSTYKLTESTNVKEIDIFKSQLLGVLITVLIGFPIGVAILYATGIGRLKALGPSSGLSITGFQMPYVISDAAPPSSYFWWMVPLAIVIVGLLFYLRSRFAWFFFSPYALFVYYEVIFLNASIAWILKLITLKVFGAKAYEEVGVPAITGFLVGLTLLATIILGINSVTGGIAVAPW
ncbi:MAG: DUF6785 family protein [Thermoproteota archaeon]